MLLKELKQLHFKHINLRHTVSFTFCYCSYSNKTGEFKTKIVLGLEDSVRKAAINVIQKAIKRGIDVWGKDVTDINNDTPIQIYVANADIKDTSSGRDYYLGWGIKYTLNNDGSLKILNGYEPLNHDWTIWDIEQLVSLKYIIGNPHHLIIGLPCGLGGGPPSFFDWYGFIVNTIQVIPNIKRIIYYPLSHKNIRIVTKNWVENGIRYPSQLREFIDVKAGWSLNEVKVRLKLDDEFAIKLLMALGLEPKGNIWRLTHTSNSIISRKRWLQNEQKYKKKNEQDTL